MRDESDENTRRRHRTEARRQSPRSSSTISTSTPRWKCSFASTRWPLTMAGPRRSVSRNSSSATSSIAAKSSCAARALNCARPRSAPRLLEGYLIALANLDEFIRIIRNSANREEAHIKLLAFEFTRAQVERWGILIRSEARLDQRPLRLQRSAGGRHSGTAPVSTDRPGNRQGRSRIQGVARTHQGPAGHPARRNRA